VDNLGDPLYTLSERSNEAFECTCYMDKKAKTTAQSGSSALVARWAAFEVLLVGGPLGMVKDGVVVDGVEPEGVGVVPEGVSVEPEGDAG